jgi:hypothetical protein
MNDGKLIDLIQSYPHLYDKKRSDLKDTQKKRNSWVEIHIKINGHCSGNLKLFVLSAQKFNNI